MGRKGGIPMWTFFDLIRNFFTHKDFLPGADQIPGTLFTPLHLLVSAICVGIIALACVLLRKKDEKKLQKIFAALWAAGVFFEIVKIMWESCCGKSVSIEWTGILPLYPCSIFMYAMPFAIWGKGNVRKAACGYVCTLGFLGGSINFVYPANVLNNYSCISFAGFETLFYHGLLVFCAVMMLVSGYHRYTCVTKWWQLLLPSAPMLAVSVVANLVNYSPINSDYMFFKLNSFIFAPIGAALPAAAAPVLVYGLYLVIHAAPYVPSFIVNSIKMRKK
jgi:hypothetical protein